MIIVHVIKEEPLSVNFIYPTIIYAMSHEGSYSQSHLDLGERQGSLIYCGTNTFTLTFTPHLHGMKLKCLEAMQHRQNMQTLQKGPS